MIFGLTAKHPLPENWTPLEAVAVIKCLSADGEPAIVVNATESLNQWEALGMLVAAGDMSRANLQEGFEEDEP